MRTQETMLAQVHQVDAHQRSGTLWFLEWESHFGNLSRWSRIQLQRRKSHFISKSGMPSSR